METQGWPLYAARDGQVYAVIGWEWRNSRGGRVAIGVELGVPLDGAPAVELGDGVTFTTDRTDARVRAGLDPRMCPNGELDAAVRRATS